MVILLNGSETTPDPYREVEEVMANSVRLISYT